MRRWISGVLAVATLAAIIAGSPLALMAWGRLPNLGHGLAGTVADGSLLLGLLTVVGWLAWAVFTVATAMEVASLRTGRRLRLPGLRAVQRLVGGLLLVALALLPSTIPDSGRTREAAVVRVAPVDPVGVSAGGMGSDAESVDGSPEVAATPAAGTTRYTVRAGDDLWSVAEHLLGDGREWRRIAELNPSLSDPTAILVAGTRLAMPEGIEAQVETLSVPSRVERTSPLVVRVHEGDTLSGLAEEHLGDAGRWPRIAAANPVITDPDHIEIGWRLTIPGARRTLDAPGGAPRSREPATAPAQSAGPTASAAPASSASGAAGAAASPAASESAEPGTSPAPGSPPDAAATPSDTAAAPAATSEPSSATTSVAGAGTASEDESLPLHTPLTIGSLAAAALVGALEARRALRERSRPVGRHRPAAAPGADRLRTHLRAEQHPASLDGLAAALRRLGRHFHDTGAVPPELAAVRVGATAIAFEWDQPVGEPPADLGGDANRWLAPLPFADDSDQPCPYPALVSLGTDASGEVLLVDAERSRVLGVAGAPQLQADALSAIGVELACAPWSRDARLVVSGEGGKLVQLAGEDRVQLLGADEAVDELQVVVAERRDALASEPLGRLRTDPDRADAVAPYVFLFLDGLADADLAAAEALLTGDPVGVALIVPTASPAPALWQVSGDPDRPDGSLAGHPGSLAAHAITAQARTSLGELLTDYEPVTAPWWTDDNVYPLPRRAEEEVDIVRLDGQAHPRLLLIGPTELVGGRGPEPARSRQQLVEMASWLLENPASTASQMVAGMALAESTRRSNLSRLRAWLGAAPDGKAYLPDAYSGRISLSNLVTSDWNQLQLMLRPGVDKVPDSTLVAALELVRGAPLADAAPGQWHWAEELRTEISGALRDVGVVLTERALRVRDLDLARWAASRALTVAPEDELLLCARVSTEYQAGNLDECERLVNQLTRQARILGVDLMPDTVDLCQRVIEGKLRARA